ncbi:MAG: hypothetical protein WBC44_22300 [Planctomycetaceae bacterium]
MKRTAGLVLILFGIGLGAWVGYATFISENPDHHIRRPGKLIVLAIGAAGVGFAWARSTPSAAAAETEPTAPEAEV